MTAYIMPLALATEAFAALAPFTADAKEASTILRGIRVSAGALYASDRKTVARYRSDLIKTYDGPPAEIVIPAEAIAWIVATKRAALRNLGARQARFIERSDHADDPYTLTVEQEGIDLTVSIVIGNKPERSQVFDALTGNFPPVERLFPDVRVDNAPMPHLSAPLLERLGKVAKQFGAETPVRLIPSETRPDAHTMLPVAFDIHGTPVDGLIQPIKVRA